MMGKKICLFGEIWLIIPKFSLSPFVSGATVWEINTEVYENISDDDEILFALCT